MLIHGLQIVILHRIHIAATIMMMIACIAINSSLVPLIEGLWVQILFWIWDTGIMFKSTTVFMGNKTYVTAKKQLVQNLILLPNIYIHQAHRASRKLLDYFLRSNKSNFNQSCVLCTHIRIHICRDLVHLDSSGPPGVWSRPLGAHPSTPCAVCVCVCVYTSMHNGNHCDLCWVFCKHWANCLGF